MKNKNIYRIVLFIILFIFIYYERTEIENDLPQVENIATEAEIEIEDPQEGEIYYVSRVVDGDTFKIDKLGTIRLIGIDTPETVDPRKEVQCYGVEASNKAKELLEGKEITLEFDNSQGDVDNYGRILAYVYMEDGRMFNEVMILEGYAHEYTYNTPYKYQNEFKIAENNARESKLGLWGPICADN
ncbi:MAG: thermonuclease family protein [Candidatus Dojkabacteria bacterium]|jgi:micrococcal nuclease|nr:thermonuclease family protein [Candidatus Dojkabacteria bacterium]